jgi:hypothetical protein
MKNLIKKLVHKITATSQMELRKSATMYDYTKENGQNWVIK